MTNRRLAVWLVLILVMTGCVAEPLDQSPLNTYPASDTTRPTPTSSTPTPPSSLEVPVAVITLAKDQPLAGRFRYDVYGPDSSAELPVVVFVHGLDGKQEIASLARVLAETNILIVPQYESPARGGRFPDPLSVTTCALGLAGEAEVYGGDPSNVTILGYGFGALAAFIVASADGLYLPPDCEFTATATPRRLIAIGGSWSPDRLASDAFDAMTIFMGGTPTGAPATWSLLDPHQYDQGTDMEVILLRGAHDLDSEVTDTFAGDLLTAGWPVVVGIIPGQTSRSALTGASGAIRRYVDN